MSQSQYPPESGKVDRSGDTMTGALTLPSDPTSDLQAATKQYVDDKPRGELGYAEVTANQSTITDADLTGLSVSLTLEAGRRIRITGAGRVINSDAGSFWIGHIVQDGSDIGAWHELTHSAANERCRSEASSIITSSAGPTTFKLTLERITGTGTANLEAASARPAFILVEDIGAA